MTKQKSETDYFKTAKDWQTDRIEIAKLHGNRWFAAFIMSTVIIVALVVSIVIMMPLKTLVPIVIHQNTKTGEVWVDRPSSSYVPETQAQTESDIVRYITTRESYSAADINQRFHLSMLLSNQQVADQYENEQANSNKASPVNVLGQNGIRTVHIEDIVFIDKAGTKQIRHFHQPSSNLAQVDFTTTTTLEGKSKTEYWVATIGWIYQGLPSDEKDAWNNWNGFTVTTYRVDHRNVNSNEDL